MWIESLNSFEIQCITEGLQIDKAGLSTKIQSQMDKTNDSYVITGMTQACKVAPSTSCPLFFRRGGLDFLDPRENEGSSFSSSA